MSRLLNLLERVFGTSKRENGNYYAFYSPFVVHHKPKLHIDVETGKWKCWISDKKSNNVFELFKLAGIDNKYYNELKLIFNLKPRHYLSNKQELEFSDIVSSLLDDTIKTEQVVNRIELPKEFTPLSITQDSFLYRRYYNYIINNRNLSKFDIVKYNIGYCPSGDYKDNVIIPSYDENYNLNFFIGRNINGGYRIPNSKIISKSNIVFFESNINWNYPINITEGVFDAITLKRNTIPLLGKSLPKFLLYKLVNNNVKEVNLYLDGDVSIRENELIKDKLLSYDIKCNIMKFNGKDTNDIGYKNVIETQEIVNFSFEGRMKELLNL